jgi:plastocyanin
MTSLRTIAGAAILLSATAAAAATKTVQVGPGGSLTFSPATVTIHVGDTVEWQWMSGPHTTTRSQMPETWDSGIASAPNTFAHTFMRAGTFPYVCTIHEALGMTGTVVVRNASAATTTTVHTGSTTSTSSAPAALSCGSVEACRAALAAALPTPGTASSSMERATARRLGRLVRRADRQLDRVAATTGSAQAHAVARSRRLLQRLRSAADRAAQKGSLGVPIAPIDAAVTSLLALDHAS